MEASESDSEPVMFLIVKLTLALSLSGLKYRERLEPLCTEQTLTEHGPKPIHLLLE